jgi:nitroreductase
MADLFAVLGAQRACREFTDAPVPDEDVERILAAATRAPSAENRQPWSFVVVRDAAVRAAIADLTRRAWDGGAAAYAAPRLDARLFEAVDAGMRGGMASAPVLVVVAGDTAATPALDASIWPAVQNLLLAANALGYGAALTTLTTVFEAELRARVGLPDQFRPMAVVPLGRPARALTPGRRRPVNAVAHRDRFGTPW